MSKEQTNDEKTGTQASEKEQLEKDPSEIGSAAEGARRYFESKEKVGSPSEEAAEKPEDKTVEPCGTCPDSVSEEELKVADEAKPRLWLMDEEGKIKVPVDFKADGKRYTPDDPGWVIKQAGLGVHSNVKTEEANKALEEYGQIKPFFEFIDKACKEGRLVVDGKKISPSEAGFGIPSGEEPEVEEKEGEEETRDPEIVKLEKKIKKQEDEMKMIKESKLREVVGQYKDKLMDNIEKLRPTYYLAYTRLEEDPEDLAHPEGPVIPLRLWDLLAKNPKMSPGEAMELSHESMMGFFDKMIEKHPEMIEKHSDRIIADYHAKKDKREEAPVGPPSGGIEGKTKPEKPTFKDVPDAMEKYKEVIRLREEAGQKS